MRKCRFFLPLVFLFLLPLAHADSIEELARDFWTWRAAEQPFSSDDIVRIERPSGWTPDWSPKAVASYRAQLNSFEARWKRLRDPSAPIPRQVDYCLIGSALSRVRWELYLTRSWEQNPWFYLDQTLGAYVHLLLDPSPFNSERTGAILKTVQSIPATLEDGKNNLAHPLAPFTRRTVERLETTIGLTESIRELKPHLGHFRFPRSR